MRHALRLIGGFFTVSVLAACGGGDGIRTDASGLPVNRPVTETEVAAMPESHLHYPGSVVVKLVGASQTPARSGEEPNPAYSGAILTAQTSASGLYAWYQRQLAPKGFMPATDYRLSTQTSGEAWEIHHRIQVQVGVFDPKLLKADRGLSVSLKAGEIVYEELVVGYPPGLPKD